MKQSFVPHEADIDQGLDRAEGAEGAGGGVMQVFRIVSFRDGLVQILGGALRWRWRSGTGDEPRRHLAARGGNALERLEFRFGPLHPGWRSVWGELAAGLGCDQGVQYVRRSVDLPSTIRVLI